MRLDTTQKPPLKRIDFWGRLRLPKNFVVIFLSYTLFGGIATVFDWGSFYYASYVLKWHYLVAVSLSFCLGTAVNFSANKYITFNNSYKNIKFQLIVYLGGALSALGLTLIQMLFFVESLHLSTMNARIITTAIMLFYNFAYHKIITFGWLR
jgi:putative flippase GtrA